MAMCPVWSDGSFSGHFWVSSQEVLELGASAGSEREVNEVVPLPSSFYDCSASFGVL